MSTIKSTSTTLDDARDMLRDGRLSGMMSSVPRHKLLPELFKVRGKPYSLDDYPQFEDMFCARQPIDMLYMCGRQIGKCVSVNTYIRTSCGVNIKADELKVGDLVSCVDTQLNATTRPVTSIFRNGVKAVKKIYTRMGSSLVLTGNHRLMTYTGYRCVDALTPGDRIASLRRHGAFGDTDQPTERIAATAYLIGDGSITEKSDVYLTGVPGPVISEFRKLGGRWVGKPSKPRKNSAAVAVRVSRQAPLLDWLRADGLMDTYSSTKFVPDWVFSLPADRTALFLSRLWATDGSLLLNKAGHIEASYTSISARLARDVRSLLIKFGIPATITRRKTRCNGKRCVDAYVVRVETRRGLEQFKATFNVPGKPFPNIPTCVSNNNRDTLPMECREDFKAAVAGTMHRKVGTLRSKGLRASLKYPPTLDKVAKLLAHAKTTDGADVGKLQHMEQAAFGDVRWDTIESIEDAGEVDTIDIEVAGEHNYVADGIISHNSSNLSRADVLAMMQVPNYQILYVAPLQSQAFRYSTLYLHESINTCAIAKTLQDRSMEGELGEGPVVKSIAHRSFSNGSGIQMMYAKTSADRARGITADQLDFDEIQDQLVDHLPIISESVTNSPWGIRRFTGTAKTTDNLIENLWQKSSQGEWVVRCQGCNHDNIPTKDGGVLKMISVDGPVCRKCGKLLNVRSVAQGGNGRLVHARPHLVDDFRGVHVPQIFVPAIAYDPVKWHRLVRKIANVPSESIIFTEILGISSDVGARLITQDDIDRASILPSHDEARKLLGTYSRICLGVDWGVAEATSFTLSCVVGITPVGQLHVLFAKRYVGMGMESVIADIAQTYRAYKCELCAADFGVGYTNNQLLMNKGLNVSQMQYVGRQNKLLSFHPILGLPRWMVDRNTALTLVFWGIKYGRIFFPVKSSSDAYTCDLLSVYETIVEDSAGIRRRKFLRNPSSPDDFAHALTFASLSLLNMAGDPLTSLVPDGATDSNNEGFPDEGVLDKEALNQKLNV